MEAADLVSNYRAKSNSELMDLATGIEELTPEAREALSAELARRGITSAEITGYGDEEVKVREQERDRKLASLFPTFRAIGRRLTIWRTFKQQTGKWPWLSMAFYFCHGFIALVVLLGLVWYSVEHGWSSLKFILAFAPIVLLDVLVAEWIQRKIRSAEVMTYRNRRRD